MPLTNPHAAPSALRHILPASAQGCQQAGMTASGRRPSSARAAQASFDAEYQQWRGERRRQTQAVDPAGEEAVDCRRACHSCTRASQALECPGATAARPAA